MVQKPYVLRPEVSFETMAQLPRVTIVFLAFNRREKLAMSLKMMMEDSDYPADRVDVIVVDNASEDGTVAMLRERYPEVRVIERTENIGVSAWNDGFALATGDYVLALDDDCYLPPAGLRNAIGEAQAYDADLVSFGVAAADDASFRFDRRMYVTGLLAFWGCAVMVRRRVLAELEGYDPRIFVWANEIEFMVRFFDQGFRHLYLPDLVAVHMKSLPADGKLNLAAYRHNSRHFAYIAGKLLRARHLPEVVLALFVRNVHDAVRMDKAALRGVGDSARGLFEGLRNRAPVRTEVSRVYAREFHSFAGPARFFARSDPLAPSLRRRERFIAARKRYYPDRAATLEV